jgi:hypothetical protein
VEKPRDVQEIALGAERLGGAGSDNGGQVEPAPDEVDVVQPNGGTCLARGPSMGASGSSLVRTCTPRAGINEWGKNSCRRSPPSRSRGEIPREEKGCRPRGGAGQHGRGGVKRHGGHPAWR